jgi:CRISPR/Cas system CSM-associated protein Csm3 (group 7 of RAMP superfamily)
MNEASANDARVMTGAVLKALQDCEIRFGAARSRGLGRVRLEKLRIREQSFSTSEALLKTLRGQDQPLELSQLGDCAFATQPGLNVAIAWKPRGPLMVKAERDGIAVDMLPLVSVIDGQLALVLPGSSIKGALRTHAERIVRTVRGINAPSEYKNPKQLFLKQIGILESPGDEEDEEKHRSLIGALFGAPGKESKKGDPDDREKLPPLLGASAITIEDCYARNHFSFAQWSRIERASEIGPANDENSLLSALRAAGLQRLQPAHHVAIDRWTGGAADGFLYTVLEPHGVEWNEIELSLDLTRIRGDERNAAIACLLLVLRDFVAGRIPLGFGVNRGMGAVQITGLEIKPQGLENDDVLNHLREIKVDGQKLVWPANDLRQKLTQAWTKWIAR